MMNWGNYGCGMGFGWIFMIIFLVLVILSIVFIVQTAMKSEKGPEHKEAPLYWEAKYANWPALSVFCVVASNSQSYPFWP